jgi:hypothetical protein
MTLLAAIGILILAFFLFSLSILTSINLKSFKYYKPSYDDLVSGKLKLNMLSESHDDDGRMYYYFAYRDPKPTQEDKLEFLMSQCDSSGTMVIVSEDDEIHSIRLVGTEDVMRRYIIYKLIPDPYTLYYRIKFRSWFKKNRERLNNIEEAIIKKSEN